MKILLTVHQYFPSFSAGTEVLTRSVARELARRGNEVRIFCGHPTTTPMHDGQRLDSYTYEDIHTYRFHHAYVPMAGQHSHIALDYDNHLAAQFFAQILDDFAPDVVHFFHFSRLGTGLIPATVAAKIPAFFTPTDFWAICPTAHLLLNDERICTGPDAFAGNCIHHITQASANRLIATAAKTLPTRTFEMVARFTQNHATPAFPRKAEIQALSARLAINVRRLCQLQKIVTPNLPMQRVLLRHGVDSNRIVLVPYGVEHSKATDHDSRRRLEHMPLRIGFIGTLVQHKGCHILIEAFKKMAAGSATLNIYGTLDAYPEYISRLKQSAHGQTSIAFCGTFPNEAISDKFKELDVLVVPSLWLENTPLVLYSAQAAGCPVVASDFEGISEVIKHDVNGLVFAPGNVSALASQLNRLAQDQTLVTRLSANAMEPQSAASYVDALLSVWNGTPEYAVPLQI